MQTRAQAPTIASHMSLLMLAFNFAKRLELRLVKLQASRLELTACTTLWSQKFDRMDDAHRRWTLGTVHTTRCLLGLWQLLPDSPSSIDIYSVCH